MKALTVWQPWASLIAEGVKPYEFRRWPFPESLIGKRIAIHAGARKMPRQELVDLMFRLEQENGKGTGLKPEARRVLEIALQSPARIPLSAVVCTAILGQPRKASALFGAAEGDSDRIDQHVWAWPMLDVIRLEPPQPATGAQGFWNWQAELADVVAAK